MQSSHIIQAPWTAVSVTLSCCWFAAIAEHKQLYGMQSDRSVDDHCRNVHTAADLLRILATDADTMVHLNTAFNIDDDEVVAVLGSASCWTCAADLVSWKTAVM